LTIGSEFAYFIMTNQERGLLVFAKSEGLFI